MLRRQIIFGTLALAVPAIASAQAPRRVGVFVQSRVGDAAVLAVLQQRLRAAGLVEGRDVVLQVESVELDDSRIEASVRRLLGAKPDVLYTLTEPLVDGLRRESGATPIVFFSVTDPVRRGYVASLAKPGGHLTGVTDRYVETGVKRLELLRDIAPRARRVGFVRSDEDPVGMDTWVRAARDLRFSVREINAEREGRQLAAALEAAARDGVDCLFPIGLLRDPGAPGTHAAAAFVAFATRAKLPAVYSSTAVVERLSGLASVEVDGAEAMRLAGDMVARVLRGEPPDSMPVEEATRIVIALNLAAAKALGIDFPQSVRLRATRVFG